MNLQEDAVLDRTAVVVTSNGPVRGYRDGRLGIFKGLRKVSMLLAMPARSRATSH